MPERFVGTILTCLVTCAAGAGAGCGSGSQHPDDGGTPDADFVQCADSPAVDYKPGLMVKSLGGGYVATLVSAKTDFSDGTSVDLAASGFDTFVITVADSSGAPAAVTMTAEKPWMPKHGHGATNFPTVTAGDPGMFTVSQMNFFMLGYWSIPLDLAPAPGNTDPDAGTGDKVTFAICIRQ